MRLAQGLTAGCLLLTSAVQPVSAHPGHGHGSLEGLFHYLLEPMHAAPLLLTVGALALLRRRRAQRQDS